MPAVRGSTTGRPIMRLLDLLGQRWVLRILWELDGGARTFRALQSACESISPAVLNTRLKLLRAHDLVALQADGYGLTDRARTLNPILMQLHKLAENWSANGDWPNPSADPQ
ncbi:winged helix-turn-helix transcriptional regulator [Sandarakinorhabdus sp.]|uniref:winged helix-turn-helix transcriptional regulator n=1 Tax=Sandarakinorhabdus sp. TaxID=1916663 RepID=UPI003F729881